MRDDEFDALLRDALRDDSWEPDATAAELRFTRLIASDTPAAPPLRRRLAVAAGRPAPRARTAGPVLPWAAAAAAAAVVAVAVAVGTGRTQPGPDTLASDANRPLSSATSRQPSSPASVPPPSDPAPAATSQSDPSATQPKAPAGEAARPPAPPALDPDPQRTQSNRPEPARSAGPPAPAKGTPGGRPADAAPRPSPPATTAPPPAAPAPAEQRYTPTQVCGQGFTVINQHKLPRSTVYLLWNGATKKNCVVTLKTADIGTATPLSARLRPSGAAETRDNGEYLYYANVTADAPGCIQWGGSDGAGTFTSPTGVHCAS